jgi:GNAT superfamily N-acetyltransferase
MVTEMIKKERNINEVTKKYKFFSKSIFNRFNSAKADWVSEVYLYLIDNKIVAFLFMMKEDLKCSFLHYHIKDSEKEYFIEKYPIINEKTNQVFFIYTEESFRKTGIGTKLLKFMFHDLFKRKYRYVWLRKETGSQIYEKLGFVNFLEMIYSIEIDSEKFLRDYELKLGCKKVYLINYFNDIRLVKILGS